MHEVLVNRLGGLSLPRKSVVRLTDRPDMTLDVYRGRKTTMQQQQGHVTKLFVESEFQHSGNKQTKIRKFLAKYCVFSAPTDLENKIIQILHRKRTKIK